MYPVAITNPNLTGYKIPDSIFPRVSFVKHTPLFLDKYKYTHIHTYIYLYIKVAVPQHPLPSVQTI